MDDFDKGLSESLIPAYKLIISTLTDIKAENKSKQGICNYENGKDFYEYLVKYNSGSARTVDELYQMMEDEMNILTACLSDTTEMFNRQWGEYMIERSPTKVSTRVESAFPQNLDWWWMEFANELTYPDYSSNYEDQTAAPGELINSYCYHIDEARSFFPDFSYIDSPKSRPMYLSYLTWPTKQRSYVPHR